MTARSHPPPAATVPQGLLLAGASGLVGRELLAQACADRAWHPVHALLRRERPVPAGARVLTVPDFAALPALPAAGSAACALGTTIAVAGSREAFRAVDHDAVLAFARAAQASGVRRLAVVSALGADARSANFYSRVKGETEAALEALGFEALVLARPSLLAGNRDALQQPARTGERLALAFTRPLGGLLPKAWRPIEAATVARAMLRALREGRPGVRRLSSADLQDLGAP